MEHYIVTKKIIFGKLRKDMVVTVEDLNESDIKRLLTKGYLKATSTRKQQYTSSNNEDDREDDETVPWYVEREDFLSPEEVNRLKKAELLHYALVIGMGELPNAKNDELEAQINAFIAEKIRGDENA